MNGSAVRECRGTRKFYGRVRQTHMHTAGVIVFRVGERHWTITLCYTFLATMMASHPFLPDCKTTFSWIFFTFFYAIFKFLRPEHDCYAKFTPCST